jgi:tRNA threonylcarbamoyladenosine biosynthesis protein TsaE
MPRATIISHGPSETEALGEAWGRAARHGDVIALDGDLGAGKTQLVRGLARGLGCGGRVHSPTFALLNEHGGGRLKLFHLDLYRLRSHADITAAGLEEYLTRPDGVAVVEWAERWFGETASTPPLQHPMPCGRVRFVRITVRGEHEREITHDDPGA